MSLEELERVHRFWLWYAGVIAVGTLLGCIYVWLRYAPPVS